MQHHEPLNVAAVRALVEHRRARLSAPPLRVTVTVARVTAEEDPGAAASLETWDDGPTARLQRR